LNKILNLKISLSLLLKNNRSYKKVYKKLISISEKNMIGIEKIKIKIMGYNQQK
jgi:hypothetical protein